MTATLEAASPLTAEEMRLLGTHWRAANYLSVGQISCSTNPLLTEPLCEHTQAAAARPLGHDTRLNLNLRSPEPGDQGPRPDMIYVIGQSRGPAAVANAWLEGSHH